MVIFTIWPWTAPDPKICSDLPMSGEGTGLGVPAPALVGYLGKNPDVCPWCAAKGQSHQLRSYRVNVQELVTLCSNPTCLFPLVSKPPENVLAACSTGRRRKSPDSPEGGRCVPPEKHPRCHEPSDSLLCRPCSVDMSSSIIPPHVLLNGFLKINSHPQKENFSDKCLSSDGLPQGACEAADMMSRVEPVAVDVPEQEAEHDSQLVVGLKEPTEGLLVKTGQEMTAWAEPEGEVQPVEEPTVRVRLEGSSVEVQPVDKPVVGVKMEKSTVEVQTVDKLALEVMLEEGDEVQPVNKPAVGARLEEEASVESPVVGARLEEEALVENPAVGARLEEEALMDSPAVGARLEEEALMDSPAVGTRLEEEALMDSPAVGTRLEEEALVENPAVGVTLEEEALVENPAVGTRLEEEALVENPAVGRRLEEEASVENPAAGVRLEEKALVVAPPRLFWKNEQNLCWLDTVLVALVHCQALRHRVAQLFNSTSVVARLIATYDRTCSSVSDAQLTDGPAVRVPAAVVHEAQRELDDLRMSTFKLLQPKLQCRLGDKETPVFALPLLLRIDSWAEEVFKHSYEWDFTCNACGHVFSNRCEKTLSTFPHVVPEWHPLNAVHWAQCSRCHNKRQRRKMVLERLPPVFALHFVKGLPHSDVDRYSFQTQEEHYSVTTVIQYNQHIKHFVAWLRTANGSWLEFDDLKHPQCTAHEALPVPAGQIHVVFWEAQGSTENPQLAGVTEVSMYSDVDIISALTVDQGDVSGVPLNATIGNSTLKDTFEGLSHGDIVTLTLVEVQVDGEGRTMSSDPGGDEPVTIGPSPNGSAEGAVLSPLKPVKPRRSRPTPSSEQTELPPPNAPLPQSPAEGAVSSDLPASLTSTRWSSLLSRHLPFQSTPILQRRPVPESSFPAPAKNTGLPPRAAETFVSFQGAVPAELVKQNHGGAAESRNQSDAFKVPGAAPSPVGKPGATAIPVVSPKQDPHQTSAFKGLDTTDGLRHKLLKKLKAKKKKLAALNRLLDRGSREQAPTPDSTAFGSPTTVSSSTSACSPAYSDFLSEYLSPATTASSRSPDSTGLLEMLANGREVGGAVVCTESHLKALPPAAPVPVDLLQSASNGLPVVTNDFLDELLSGSCVAESTDLESTFDLFF